MRATEPDHAIRKLESARRVGDECARPMLHIEHEACETLGQLLTHDARRDQWQRFDGSRGIAQRIHPAIRRGNLRALADHHAPDLLELRTRLREREVGAKPRDGLELVERATGMAQAPSGNHWHRHADRCHEWREHERHLVAHAARRVLVHTWRRQRGGLEDCPAV